jgi:universal stress protein E
VERFKNILVGVDISELDQFVSDKPAGPSQAAIDRAIWLAKANQARLVFMYVLDKSTIQIPADQKKLPLTFPDQPTLTDNAQAVLSRLVDQAQQQGVVAELQVTAGKSWIELIRHVDNNHHDLLIAGTRRFGAIRSTIFGSTGIKLLRNCPCPVWITQPQPERISSILVAHDLEPVGDLAMELGCSMAKNHDAQLHVFHAIEFPEMDYMFPSRILSEDIAKYRDNATQHISAQLSSFQLSESANIHLDYGTAYAHILQMIKQHNVDLLVMGTIARTGLAGFITGNTAERLLPHISCSVIAVKPADFKSPVTFE